jgi:hypothetical protein
MPVMNKTITIFMKYSNPSSRHLHSENTDHHICIQNKHPVHNTGENQQHLYTTCEEI